MRQLSLLVSIVVIVLAGSLAFGRVAPGTAAQDATPTGSNPTAGERDHLDLAVHFAWEPDVIAHHWCKAVAGGFFECLIYASDDADAPLIGVDPAEQRLWHSNVVEAASGADPNRPAPSLEEAAAEAEEAGGATYGKLILFGDPETVGQLPMGEPRVIYPSGTEPGTPTP